MWITFSFYGKFERKIVIQKCGVLFKNGAKIWGKLKILKKI